MRLWTDHSRVPTRMLDSNGHLLSSYFEKWFDFMFDLEKSLDVDRGLIHINDLWNFWNYLYLFWNGFGNGLRLVLKNDEMWKVGIWLWNDFEIQWNVSEISSTIIDICDSMNMDRANT